MVGIRFRTVVVNAERLLYCSGGRRYEHARNLALTTTYLPLGEGELPSIMVSGSITAL